MNDLNLIEVGKRIKRAVNYLIYLEDMDDRKEFSNKFGYDYTNLSKVFKGNPKYVNLKFISRMCETYPNVFIENWFITGEGQMLKEASSSPPANERESIYREMLDLERDDKERLRIEHKNELEALRIELKNELEALRRDKDDEIRNLIVHEAELEQRLSLFTSEKPTAPRKGNVAGAVGLKKTGTDEE